MDSDLNNQFCQTQVSKRNYMPREIEIKNRFEAQQEYFNKNKNVDEENFQLENINIVIDSSNKRLNSMKFQDFQDFKFSADLPQITKNNRKIILNPFVDLLSLAEYPLLEQLSPGLPVCQQEFFEKDNDKIQLIVSYLKSNLVDEQDVLIYCADLNQMEQLRLLLDGLARIKPIINQKLTALYEQLFQDSRSYKNTIYLLLEPQYLPSEQITLIVHCPTKQIIRAGEQHSISTTTVQLSQTELCIREIPKSNTLGVKILYAFTEQTYLQLPIKPQNYDTSFCSFHENNQQLAIIIAVLQTPGSLLIDKSNINFTVRTSPYWSKLGDGISWINIITHLSTRVQRILDSEDTQEYSRELQKWCSQNVINVLKGLLVILKMEEFAEQMNHPELALIQSLNSMPQLQKQASSINERVDEKSLELLLKDHFPEIVRSEPKLYTYKGDLLPLRNNNIQRLISHYLSDAYLLGLKDGEIEFMNNISSRKASFNQKEYTLVNIGNAIMNELWKNEGIEIYRFEEQNNCTVDPNLELNLISVYSDQNVEIKNLEALIEQTRNNLANEVLIVPFYNNTKFIISAGGIVIDWIDSNESKGIIVKNLPLNITESEIREYFDDVEILQVKVDNEKCEARLLLQSKEVTNKTISEYNNCQFLDKVIEIDNLNLNQEKSNTNCYRRENILYLIWSYQICLGKATIVFKHKSDLDSIIDVANKQFLLTRIDATSVELERLEPKITEYEILTYFGGESKVAQISMDTRILFEPRGDISSKLGNEAKAYFGKNAILSIKSIKRKFNYSRVAKLIVEDQEVFEKTVNSFNHFTSKIGQNTIKINIRPQYRVIMLIPYYKMLLYKDRCQQIIDKFGCVGVFKNINEYDCIFKLKCSNSYLIFNTIVNLITNIFQGQQIIINDNNQILFSQVGAQKLKELEGEFKINFEIDQINHKIFVHMDDTIPIENIQQKINKIFNQSIQYSIQMESKIFKKILGIDGKGIEDFINRFSLFNIIYRPKTQSLILEGDVKCMEQAKLAIQNILSTDQQTSDSINQSVSKQNIYKCGFCIDQIQNGYLLQNCGHTFCFECIIFYLANNIKDITTLPIECPQCQELLFLEDILNIIGQDSFNNLLQISIKKYISELQNAIFCTTKDCPNIIDFIKTSRCSLCGFNYCEKCHLSFHPGYTCEQFRIGDQKLLEILMANQDIRRCPKCNVLAQRISGCDNVLCFGCKYSICWRKKKDGTNCMKCFKIHQDCYAHIYNHE